MTSENTQPTNETVTDVNLVEAQAPTAPAPEQPKINVGADTFVIGQGEQFNVEAIKEILEKPKQFVVITGKDQFATAALYVEEVKVLKGLFARLEQYKLGA